jgi:homoserine O-acetyltransferase/O-succinyltransferase
MAHARRCNFEVAGPAHAPLVVVLGGISATRHVTATSDDPTPGWWNDVVGPERAIDTTRFRVLSIDFLDGGRTPDGRPARIVTTHEQADAVADALDTIGASSVDTVIGASYGGMVALAFAERYPDRLERLVVFGAAHEPAPMTTALRAVQRHVVELGLETGQGARGLALARALAMTTYRSPREFSERFATAPDETRGSTARFPVERYLLHCGEQFAATFPPERFLALSLSADLHRVRPESIRTPTLLIAAEDDAIVPRQQMKRLAASIDAPTRLVPLPTRHGHDAFLADPELIGSVLSAQLTTAILV